MLLVKLFVLILLATIGAIIGSKVKNENKYICGYIVGSIVMVTFDLIDYIGK